MSSLRQYQGIWLRLKRLSLEDATSVGITLIAHRAHHPRICKAIKKEKWMDYSYKLLNDREATLRFNSDGARLTVFLDQSLTAEDF